MNILSSIALVHSIDDWHDACRCGSVGELVDFSYTALDKVFEFVSSGMARRTLDVHCKVHDPFCPDHAALSFNCLEFRVRMLVGVYGIEHRLGFHLIYPRGDVAIHCWAHYLVEGDEVDTLQISEQMGKAMPPAITLFSIYNLLIE